MDRVLIIGSNGAGKSTFSYRLSDKTGLPLIHLDQIYWHDDWQVTPRGEFEARVLARAREPRWIIEGNNIRSLGQRLRYADTVIWFEFPPIVCMANILKREIRYRNTARPDMPAGCVSRLDLKFLRYAWDFNKNNRSKISLLLESYPHVEVVRFSNYREVEGYLKGVGRSG